MDSKINVENLKKVKNIIAIGSGKGGVGKSTVAVNLAASFAKKGFKVGLLDADIYGPSIPKMMGNDTEPIVTENLMIPQIAHGIKFMSMGFFAKNDKPLIWRGPMAHKAIVQLLTQVDWGELDILLVDLPPGTSDVHISLVQTVPVTGAVIVSTPQDVGMTISMKTLRMFQETKTPILGIIENMSYHICSHCNGREEIFGHGGAKKASQSLEVPFLGEIPLDMKIRVHSDDGVPLNLREGNESLSKSYDEISQKLSEQINLQRNVPC